MLQGIFQILKISGAILSTKMSGSPESQLKWILTLILGLWAIGYWAVGGSVHG